MSITTALKARREAIADREAGFTLIELLVVVLIIGILAAIAIPVYLGVQNSAKDSAVKSDLVTDKTALAAYGTANNGGLPTLMTTPANQKTSVGSYGWVQSQNNTGITYTAGTTAGTYCLLATSSTNNKFFVTSNLPVTGGTTTTVCPTDKTTW